jgi:uncharacterized membrane protein
MADQATLSMRIDAPLDTIREVLLDFEQYPTWARDIKSVSVLTRNAEGVATDVRYRAAAMGRSTSYTLRYDHSDAPLRLAWVLAEGDIMRQLDGAYEFEVLDDASTLVSYDLHVDLVVPLPGFVKRRAETRIVNTALRELRDHVQSR